MSNNNISSARRAYAKSNHIGFTQEDAARHFGVSIGTYRNWEQGRVDVSSGQLCELADLYGVTVDFLLGKTDCMDIREHNISDALTDEESRLVRSFRSLPQAQRDAVLVVVEGIAGA